MTLGKTSRVQWGYHGLPWLKDSNVVASWCSDPTYVIPNTLPAITGCNKEAGANALGQSAMNWTTSYTGSLGYGFFAVQASGHMDANAISSSFSGTGVPWTIIFLAMLSADPVSGTLIGFGRSSSSSPEIRIVSNGGLGVSVRRKNNAATLFQSSTISLPGYNVPSVISARYDGANITTRLNGAVIDNQIAFGAGALTVDQFSIGAWSSTSIVQPCANLLFRRVILANTALSTSVLHSYEYAAGRQIGIAIS